MKQTQSQSGYSLVEALVAISVLLIAIVGPMVIATQGIKSSSFALEQNTAFFLAQEGIEAMFELRSEAALGDVNSGADSWSWVDAIESAVSGCTLDSAGDSCVFGVDYRSNTLRFTGDQCNPGNETECLLYTDAGSEPVFYIHDSDGEASPFTRTITLTYDTFSVDVEVDVTWTSAVFEGAEQQVRLNTTLFDIVL